MNYLLYHRPTCGENQGGGYQLAMKYGSPLEFANDQLFRLGDRKHSEFCLAPTNEEDITSLIAGNIQSWRALPLRVYQISMRPLNVGNRSSKIP